VRRLAVIALVLACLAGIAAFQLTRPQRATGDPRVFVPSPKFYLDFSPSFRTTVADAYWLLTVQYYGEHVTGDKRVDSLPDMLDLVTRLSPHFTRAYLFGAFALLDANKPRDSYDLLVRGFKENPDEWKLPATIGFFVYSFASNKDKDRIAAGWYQKAAAIAGRPDYIPRLAAELLTRGGERQKAEIMWAQVYAEGDKYAQDKAVKALDELLPQNRDERLKAMAPLAPIMPSPVFNELLARLFARY